jgi:AraC-like DNA-binding protein
MEIGYCHYGEGSLVIEDNNYRFRSGMISIIPANILHVTVSDANVTAFWEYMYISPEEILKSCGKTMQETKEISDVINGRAFFKETTDIPMISTLVHTIFDEMKAKHKYHQECVKGLVYSLVFEIARHNGRKDGLMFGKNISLKLGKAIDYVELNYADDFKIADLALECNMSETHFRRVFQEKMNMSPIEYVNFVRVKKACELIDKTEVSMEEVACKVGFSTPSTFNRNFRKVMGTSPYQWKKRPDNHEGRLLDYKISALKGW